VIRHSRRGGGKINDSSSLALHVVSSNPSTGSEELSKIQLFIPRECAHDTIYELGETGNVHILDVSWVMVALFLLPRHHTISDR
jgi:hypothetical protein